MSRAPDRQRGARVLPFRPRRVEEPESLERESPANAAPTRRDHEAPPLRRGGASPSVTPLRRHRGARLRHSRRPRWQRFAKPFALALFIVGGPTLLSVWVFRSPAFALTDVVVTNDDGRRVSDAWVRHALSPARGWNLPRLPLPWIDAALKRHPWVEATALRKDLPNRLSVHVIEKKEVALEHRATAGDDEPAFWYLDRQGAAIAPFDPAPGVEIDLPIVTGGSGAIGFRPALALREEITTVEPGWGASLSEIEILGEQDFRVWSAGLAFPLLVRSGTLAHKTSYLQELLPEIARRYPDVEAVDLRFARRIIVQPNVRRTAARRGAGVHQRGLGG